MWKVSQVTMLLSPSQFFLFLNFSFQFFFHRTTNWLSNIIYWGYTILKILTDFQCFLCIKQKKTKTNLTYLSTEHWSPFRLLSLFSGLSRIFGFLSFTVKPPVSLPFPGSCSLLQRELCIFSFSTCWDLIYLFIL